MNGKLSWKYHITFVCTKVMKSVGIIRKMNGLVHQACFLTLYDSLIYPYLIYCNIVCASTYASYIHKLLIQNTFARLNTSNYLAPSAPLFKKRMYANHALSSTHTHTVPPRHCCRSLVFFGANKYK